MTKISNEDLHNRVWEVRKMQKVAEEVTLMEFIEQYPRVNHIVLASMWFAINPELDDFEFDKAEVTKSW